MRRLRFLVMLPAVIAMGLTVEDYLEVSMTLQEWLNLGSVLIDHGPDVIAFAGVVYGAWKVGGIKNALTMGLQHIGQLHQNPNMTDAEKKADGTAKLQALLPSGFKQFAPLVVEILHKQVNADEKLTQDKIAAGVIAQADKLAPLMQPTADPAPSGETSPASTAPVQPAA